MHIHFLFTRFSFSSRLLRLFFRWSIMHNVCNLVYGITLDYIFGDESWFLIKAANAILEEKLKIM